MKQFLGGVSLAIMLSACASTNTQNYMAADDQGDFGYYESALTDKHYRIAYKMRGDDIETAKDYALLRGAELTLQKGYEWFEIVDRETSQKTDDRHARAVTTMRVYGSSYRECGLLSCRTVTRPDYVDASFANNAPRRSDTTVIFIEIMMGNGMKPSGGSIYDARTLAETIRARS